MHLIWSKIRLPVTNPPWRNWQRVVSKILIRRKRSQVSNTLCSGCYVMDIMYQTERMLVRTQPGELFFCPSHQFFFGNILEAVIVRRYPLAKGEQIEMDLFCL